MSQPKSIILKNIQVNNISGLSLKVPLNQFVGICGVSGSGKSSLAMDVLYAEGSRRYLASLSAFSRVRMKQSGIPNVESIDYLPSAIALRQRPEIPNRRSTVGTISEALNVLRLTFSRLGTHICPNGHAVSPNISILQDGQLTCPICNTTFLVKSAEDFSFNSNGKCQQCGGVGELVDIDKAKVVEDPSLSIREGAIASWKLPGTFFLPFAAQALGVDIDIPFESLPADQKELVLSGEKQQVKAKVESRSKKSAVLDVTYTNASQTLLEIYKKTTSTATGKKLTPFLTTIICPTCHGTRLDPSVLKVKLDNLNIAEAANLQLDDFLSYTSKFVKNSPTSLVPVAKKLRDEIIQRVQPLIDLGLNYLTLDRAGKTLSTGELQRLQLTKVLRNKTTGVLYVLDEPSIGLHPENIAGLIKIFQNLVAQGNSLVVVDHNLNVLKHADYLIEMGPAAGKNGGLVIAKGTLNQILASADSQIAPFFKKQRTIRAQRSTSNHQKIVINLNQINNIKDAKAEIPLNSLVSVVGVSGSGKTSLILDGLVPGLRHLQDKKELPQFVQKLDAPKMKRIISVDASPIGKNNRSSVGTYTQIFDQIRHLFSETALSKRMHFTASRFSYNTKEGVCPTCKGLGRVSLDVQFLPNIDLVCPTCHGKRYNDETLTVQWKNHSISDFLNMPIEQAINYFDEELEIKEKMAQLIHLGLGYLKLGEETLALSGGEAQRLKLVSEFTRNQNKTLFIFDEPSTGLHPLDIQALLHISDALLENGASIIYLEHDLDMIANSDYIIEMGPSSGSQGGKIVWQGDRTSFLSSANTKTSKYLKNYS